MWCVAGMMYPEFQYRRPPPTYAASMQEYNSQLALAQATNNNSLANTSGEDYSLPGSPPPSYRSRASTIHSGVHITFPPGHDSAPNSRPPTYRSRAEGHQRPRLPLDEATADVAFTGPGPAMNADTVQQIIGTRAHHRQGSGGAGVWHTRSASADLAQGPDTARHRRGASLDNTTTSSVLGASLQGPHGPSPLILTQSGSVTQSGSATQTGSVSQIAGTALSGSVAQTESAATSGSATQSGPNTVTVRVAHSSVSTSNQNTNQTQANSGQPGSGSGQTEGSARVEQREGVTSVTINASSREEEPDQYNTAL